MDPIEIAEKLKAEANTLLMDFGIAPSLGEWGEVVYTGSYALDLMAWNDVDIQLRLKSDFGSAEALVSLTGRFIPVPNMSTVRVEKGLKKKIPALPDGDYLQLKLDVGEYKLPWKFDIWIVGDQDYDDNQRQMNKWLEALTPEKRKVILEVKQAIMLPKGRTPSMSSFSLYEAVLIDNILDKKEIIKRLQNSGVVGV